MADAKRNRAICTLCGHRRALEAGMTTCRSCSGALRASVDGLTVALKEAKADLRRHSALNLSTRSHLSAAHAGSNGARRSVGLAPRP